MSDQAKPYAKRSFGQNFLVDQNFIRKIVDALRIVENEEIIEIGPGRGALSDEILRRGGQLTAIELDRDMVEVLNAKFKHNNNFRLISEDALKVHLAHLVISPPAKLAANLPYYISTPILRRLIEFRGLFSSLVLMFQREVADRITAKPGSKERGFLTVLVEASLSVEKLFNVPPTAFKPPPKVWSSVVRLTPKPSQVTDTKLFEQVVSTGFGQKRKTILNNLKLHFTDAGDALIAAEVDKNARAEALSLDDWIRLATALKAGKT